VCSRKLLTIQMQGLPRTTLWWRICHTPCEMSSLEVLQRFPSQRKAMLSTLGSAETCNRGMIMIDTNDLKLHLPYHVAFYIVGCLDMHDVIGVLEGHWPTRFVFITDSSYRFRWSFIPTTWRHPLFPCIVRGKDRVCRG
jgi:hypothetical protein